MKISYKILWIDDQLDHIEEDRIGAEEFLEQFGIHADISTVTNPADQSIPDSVEKHIRNPELDLLLVDYHMDGMNGAELVDRIRNTDSVYLPVIFYSARDIEDILKAAYDAQLDGVYITHRNQLIGKFRKVVQSLLKKEHTTKRTRGLLMEEVSEIDARFKAIYESVWEKLSEDNRQKLIQYLKNIIADQAKNAEKKSEKFPADLESFSRHMDEKFLSPSYDTFTRWRIVCKMLEYMEYDSGNREILKEFKNRLLDLRNTYAHRTKQELQENHSEDQCVEIRREIRRQLDNVNHIIANTVSDLQ